LVDAVEAACDLLADTDDAACERLDALEAEEAAPAEKLPLAATPPRE
jgi:hypothetical protein